MRESKNACESLKVTWEPLALHVSARHERVSLLKASSSSPTTVRSLRHHHHSRVHQATTASSMAQFTDLPYELRFAIFKHFLQNAFHNLIKHRVSIFEKVGQQIAIEALEAAIAIIKVRKLVLAKQQLQKAWSIRKVLFVSAEHSGMTFIVKDLELPRGLRLLEDQALPGQFQRQPADGLRGTSGRHRGSQGAHGGESLGNVV